MKARTGASLFFVIVLVALAALAALFARGRSRDTRQMAYRAMMKSDLMNLSQVETRHRVAHGRYTTDLDSLKFHWSSGVQLVDMRVTADGWSASVRHAEGTGVCSIEVNAANPGRPVCP